MTINFDRLKAAMATINDRVQVTWGDEPAPFMSVYDDIPAEAAPEDYRPFPTDTYLVESFDQNPDLGGVNYSSVGTLIVNDDDSLDYYPDHDHVYTNRDDDLSEVDHKHFETLDGFIETMASIDPDD